MAGVTGRSDRIIDHFEFRVGKEDVKIPVRMLKKWKGWEDGGWVYSFYCQDFKHLHERIDHTDIKRLKELVREAVEQQLLSVEFVRHFLVKIRGTGYYRKEETEADAGIAYEEVWIGKLPDGTPCYKESEKGVITPREISLLPGDEFGDGWITRALILATPANEAALKMIMQGIVRINDRMRELLNTENIQKTLQQFSMKQLMPPEGPDVQPRKGRKRPRS